jgi:hypothetical protein
MYGLLLMILVITRGQRSLFPCFLYVLEGLSVVNLFLELAGLLDREEEFSEVHENFLILLIFLQAD